MINVKQLANMFEDGLNAVLGNPEIQFKIWANAGEYQKPVRDGNTIVHEIVGNLRTNTSANDANNVLVMGVNGLALEFMVPVYPPRTNATQTEAELEKIVDSQYPFIEYIANAINTYFQKAQAVTISETAQDGTVINYSAAFQAGVVVPNTVGLVAHYGQALPISVNIQVIFIEEGTNSQDVKITVDGELMPFQNSRIGRAPVVERDVYAGSTVSKCIISSTALSIDADFPSSVNKASSSALEYVLRGEPNTAHFVNVEWGDGTEELYFMCYNTVQCSATGIAVAGISASFMEIIDNKEIYNVPAGYQVVRFRFAASINSEETPITLSFTLSEEVNSFISGIGAAVRGGSQTIELNSGSFEYDEAAENYFVTFVTEKAVTITDASASFEIIEG